MKCLEGLEKSARPARPKRLAKSIASCVMVLSLTSCRGGHDEPKTTSAPVPAGSASHNPAVGRYAKYYGADLLKTSWEAPETHNLAGQRLKIYSEKHQESTKETKQQLLKAAANSLVLTVAGVKIDVKSHAAINSHPTFQTPPEQSHVFFLFGSVDSMANADPEGSYGPITATKVMTGGQIGENLTMLAPFPRSHFIFHSELDDTLYKRQSAVCGNIIDVDIGIDAKTMINMANSSDKHAAAAEQVKESLRIKRAACENLALAVTIQAGSRHVEHLGGSYAYYSGITDALQEEAKYNGRTQPYIKLPPAIFSQLVA